MLSLVQCLKHLAGDLCFLDGASSVGFQRAPALQHAESAASCLWRSRACSAGTIHVSTAKVHRVPSQKWSVEQGEPNQEGLLRSSKNSCAWLGTCIVHHRFERQLLV